MCRVTYDRSSNLINSEQRNASIDSFKALLCIIVIITHIWTQYTTKFGIEEVKYAVWGIGKFSVGGFFVISGFLSLEKKYTSASAFLKKRIIRIMVPYIATLVLGYVIGWCGLREAVNLIDFSKSKGHLWTLSVEMKFYFLFALFVIISNKYKINERIVLLLLIIIMISSIVIFPPKLWSGNNIGLQWYISLFALGMIISLVQNNLNKKQISNMIHIIFDVGFIILLLLFTLNIPILREKVFNVPMDTSLVNRYLPLGFCAGLMLFCLLNSFYIKKLFERNKFFKEVGKRSFSIYLIHYLVFWKVTELRVNEVMFFIISLSITGVLSCIFYEVVEKRITARIINVLD